MKSVFALFLLFLLLGTAACRDENKETAPLLENVQSNELFAFFNDIDSVRGQTADDPPATFIAELSLGYKKGDTQTQSELIEKKPQIQNTILKYLSGKKADELHPKNFETMQQELVTEINRLLTKGKLRVLLFQELQAFAP